MRVCHIAVIVLLQLALVRPTGAEPAEARMEEGAKAFVRGAFAEAAEAWKEAARVLGLSATDTWARVILPQALVRALPPLNNVLIAAPSSSA